MSRGRQYIQFEGYFVGSVPAGILRIIQGLAVLLCLVAVSVTYEMTGHVIPGVLCRCYNRWR